MYGVERRGSALCATHGGCRLGQLQSGVHLLSALWGSLLTEERKGKQFIGILIVVRPFIGQARE